MSPPANKTELNNAVLLAGLSASVESSTKVLETLLVDIGSNATSLAVLKEKMVALTDDVSALSDVMNGSDDGRGTIATRVALAEKSIGVTEERLGELKATIKSAIDEIKEDVGVICEDQKQLVGKVRIIEPKEEKMSKIKLASIVAPGAVALILTVIKLIFGVG